MINRMRFGATSIIVGILTFGCGNGKKGGALETAEDAGTGGEYGTGGGRVGISGTIFTGGCAGANRRDDMDVRK